MAVRSAMPWPLRWAVVAIVFGFCASIGLWAFEFGKDIAGLDQGSKAEMLRLRTQVTELQSELEKAREDRDKAQSIANTAGTLVTVEKAAQEKVLQQLKQLEADNRTLKDDLGFFEKLIPSSGVDGVAIRGLQAELQNDVGLKWQILVIQASKNAAEFNGKIELTFTGQLAGKPWTATLPQQVVKVKQYGRLEGVFEVPAQVVVKGVSARILEGTAVRATQSIKL
jgi:DNA-binding protein YbaB